MEAACGGRAMKPHSEVEDGLRGWEGSGSKSWGTVLSDQEEENLKVKRSYVGKIGRVRKRPGRGGVVVAEVRGVSTSRECSCG